MIAPSNRSASNVKRRYARGDSSDSRIRRSVRTNAAPGSIGPRSGARRRYDPPSSPTHPLRVRAQAPAQEDLMAQRYDEFGLFAENAAEVGLPYDGPPVGEPPSSRSPTAIAR